MDAEKFVAAIERFFLDVIGTIIPGLVLLAGVLAVFGPVRLAGYTLGAPAGDGSWALVVVAAYVLGHAMTSLGENVVQPLAVRARRVRLLRRLTTSEFVDYATLSAHTVERASTQAVARALGGPDAVAAPAQVGMLRNTAMTIAPEGTQTVLRFTFISLLNLGVATALWVLAVLVLVARGLRAYALASAGAPAGELDGLLLRGLLISVLLVLVSFLFLERRFEFWARSQRLPFDMALGRLNEEKRKAAAGARPAEAAPEPGAAPAVYLAGGGDPGWRDRVIGAVRGARWLDPRGHALADPRAAAQWALAAVRRSDVVFAHLDGQADGAPALALELGYAKALGKHVILVDGAAPAAPAGALAAAADVTADDLEQGIRWLDERLKMG